MPLSIEEKKYEKKLEEKRRKKEKKHSLSYINLNRIKDTLEKNPDEMINEKNKKREELIQKRTEELIKAYNHRSQLDILRQEQ